MSVQILRALPGTVHCRLRITMKADAIKFVRTDVAEARCASTNAQRLNPAPLSPYAQLAATAANTLAKRIA